MNQELFTAIRAGDTEQVTTLLDTDPGLIDAKDEHGLSALTIAKYSCQETIAKMLVDRGASLDIFSASTAGVQSRVVELLAQDRGLVNSYSSDGWTPLHVAAFFSQKEIAEVLLANGADVHARSRNAMGNTPLHAAVAARNVDVVPVLLVHGADVKARAENNQNALDLAMTKGHQAMVDLLDQHGASRQP